MKQKEIEQKLINLETRLQYHVQSGIHDPADIAATIVGICLLSGVGYVIYKLIKVFACNC
jgi:hypothetical protein